MTEIKKITKIVLIYYSFMGFLFAFLYLVLTELTRQLMQWPYYDPLTFWSMGATMLILSIGFVIALTKKEWEEIKLFFFVSLMWVLATLIMDIVSVAILNLPETPMMQMIFNIVLLSINLVLGIYCWMKQKS